MPLSITASHTSSSSSSPYRVSKPKRPSFLTPRKKFSSSTSNSPSASSTRHQQRSNLNNYNKPQSNGSGTLLPDHGPAPCIPPIITTKATSVLPSNTVVDMMSYISTTHMFDPIPARRSGMNSTRIAEILNFRRALPPIVTKGHVLALSSSLGTNTGTSTNTGGIDENSLSSRSYTSVEREIAGLVAKGIVRKVIIPGLVAGGGSGRRGMGNRFRLGGGGGGSGGVEMTTAGGEGLVLVKEWERMVNQCAGLSEDIKKKYLSALHANPTSPTITLSASSISTDSAPTITISDTLALIQAGFLTSSSSSSSSSSSPSASIPNISSIPTSNQNKTTTNSYTFSLPNTGPYLYLLRTAKEQLRSLAVKTSSSSAPKTKPREVARNILKMRWDGTGVSSSAESTTEENILVTPAGAYSTSTSNTNPSESVTSDPGDSGGFVGPVSSSSLPSPVSHAGNTVNPRIRKWKQFRGLAFDWVLCECVGSGAMECFETGTVGIGVRLC